MWKWILGDILLEVHGCGEGSFPRLGKRLLLWNLTLLIILEWRSSLWSHNQKSGVKWYWLFQIWNCIRVLARMFWRIRRKFVRNSFDNYNDQSGIDKNWSLFYFFAFFMFLLLFFRFDLILTSDTVYRIKNYDHLHNVFEKYLTKEGQVYVILFILGICIQNYNNEFRFVCGKDFYFGNDGGMLQFSEYISTKATFTKEIALRDEGNVTHTLLELRRS